MIFFLNHKINKNKKVKDVGNHCTLKMKINVKMNVSRKVELTKFSFLYQLVFELKKTGTQLNCIYNLSIEKYNTFTFTDLSNSLC